MFFSTKTADETAKWWELTETYDGLLILDWSARMITKHHFTYSRTITYIIRRYILMLFFPYLVILRGETFCGTLCKLELEKFIHLRQAVWIC